MNEIHVGDLVMVVHTCCERRVHPVIYEVGLLVDSYTTPPGCWLCEFCEARLPNEVFAIPVGPFSYGRIAQPLSWLKRLDPNVLEQETRQQEKVESETANN